MGEPVRAEVQVVWVGDFDNTEDTNLIELDDLVLANPSHFGIDVHVWMGQPGGKGSDDFQMIVCTPSWFAEHAALDEDWALWRRTQEWTGSDEVLIGTGLWFMRRWSPEELLAVLANVCAEASGGPDWGTVASRIGRSIPWEFDYMHDADVNESQAENK